MISQFFFCCLVREFVRTKKWTRGEKKVVCFRKLNSFSSVSIYSNRWHLFFVGSGSSVKFDRTRHFSRTKIKRRSECSLHCFSLCQKRVLWNTRTFCLFVTREKDSPIGGSERKSVSYTLYNKQLHGFDPVLESLDCGIVDQASAISIRYTVTICAMNSWISAAERRVSLLNSRLSAASEINANNLWQTWAQLSWSFCHSDHPIAIWLYIYNQYSKRHSDRLSLRVVRSPTTGM